MPSFFPPEADKYGRYNITDIPTTEPTEIIVGDTLKWRREDLTSNYPASAGWALTYALRGPQKINITASADGDYFEVNVTAANTADYKAGDYWWSAYVTKGAERYQIDSGTLKIISNLSAIGDTYDGRSHAKIVLDAIEAVIAKRATKDQMGYSIAGQSLSKTPIADLLLLRDRYKIEYQRELDVEKIANGKATGNRILSKFK